ncbi:MAG: hypothetical protein ACFE91_05140 [Promethearchaeota archaeon]
MGQLIVFRVPSSIPSETILLHNGQTTFFFTILFTSLVFLIVPNATTIIYHIECYYLKK